MQRTVTIKLMLRSTSRLALLLSISMFSLAAYAQQGSSSQPKSAAPPGAAQDQQHTTPDQQQTTAPAPPANSGQDQELPNAPESNTQTAPPIEPQGPTAVFDTSMGRMTCRLYSKLAPLTVANFVGLATGKKEWTDPVTHKKVLGKPFYDGTTFHRVIPDFMIQGGDRLGTGEGDAGYYFKDEVTPALNFDVAGRLAMANAGPNTNGSQFFITVTPQPTLDQHYSIFGQCDTGSVLVAQTITQVPRNSRDKPLEPVYLNKVTIVEPGQPMPPPPPPAAPQPSAPATGRP